MKSSRSDQSTGCNQNGLFKSSVDIDGYVSFKPKNLTLEIKIEDEKLLRVILAMMQASNNCHIREYHRKQKGYQVESNQNIALIKGNLWHAMEDLNTSNYFRISEEKYINLVKQMCKYDIPDEELTADERNMKFRMLRNKQM